MYLHFMGKLIHQNQIKQDLSIRWRNNGKNISGRSKAYLKDFYWSFQILEKKSLRIIFMNALCKYFETYKTLQVV